MKKLALLLAATLLLSLAACGGSKGGSGGVVQNDAPQLPKVQVQEESGAKPEWVELGDAVGTYEGTKVIFFIGYGESKFKDSAKEAAQLNGSTEAAAAIKRIASKQVAKAWENIGAGENETKEQVMKGLEAMTVKNVDVSGLRRTGVYWRLVSKPKIEGGKFSGQWTAPMYEYYVRFAMNYDKYEQKRDGLIAQEKKEVKLNERQKKLYADMEKKLDELDQAAQ